MQDVSILEDAEIGMQEHQLESNREEEKAIQMYLLQEQPHAFRILRRMAYLSDTVDDRFMSSLRRLHTDIRRDIADQLVGLKVIFI